ncbi:MBL fold metallo-hydrolase [Spongisporangium articulatum]|uniref:MBL fold metallo-hydrolase n=1 Tax=Spongisporangium articulatum TaxID=3362603 RepID=A0ABW8ATW2_9ACTN
MTDSDSQGIRVTGELQQQAWSAQERPPVETVRPGLWSVPVPIPDNPLRYTLTYVVEATDGLVVVDPGWATDGAWTALLAGFAHLGAGPEDVLAVVVTHVHPDHHGLSARLRKESGAWVGMHAAEVGSLPARVPMDEQEVSDRHWLDRCGVPDDMVPRLIVSAAALEPFMDLAEPDRLLDDGQLLPVEGAGLRVVHTPGHTPGHVCLHHEGHDVLLTGDHVLPRISPNIGMQSHDSPPALSAYLRSLALVAERYDSVEVLPAHEYRFTGLAARARTLQRHHEERCAEISAALRGGASTVWDVTTRISWSRGWENVRGIMRRAAVAETAAHLRYMVDQGTVSAVENPDGPIAFTAPSA